jgi:hypothetical protein
MAKILESLGVRLLEARFEARRAANDKKMGVPPIFFCRNALRDKFAQ